MSPGLYLNSHAWFRNKDFAAGQILRKDLPEPANGRLVAVDKNDFFWCDNFNISAEAFPGSMPAEVDDIAAALEAKGFEVDRRKIQLADPIKTVGDYEVAIKLYREVTAHVKVKVQAEATEEVAAKHRPPSRLRKPPPPSSSLSTAPHPASRYAEGRLCFQGIRCAYFAQEMRFLGSNRVKAGKKAPVVFTE